MDTDSEDKERIESIESTCREKVTFLTKDEAKRTKHILRKRNGRQVSVYKCQNCRCWHFTSFKESD